MRERSIDAHALPVRSDMSSPGRRVGLRSAAVLGLLILGACTVPADQATQAENGELDGVPDQVVALAAPYQSLENVVLRPEDGCYWYRHVGPVETTMLPLLTSTGRAICAQVAPTPQT